MTLISGWATCDIRHLRPPCGPVSSNASCEACKTAGRSLHVQSEWSTAFFSAVLFKNPTVYPCIQFLGGTNTYQHHKWVGARPRFCGTLDPGAEQRSRIRTECSGRKAFNTWRPSGSPVIVTHRPVFLGPKWVDQQDGFRAIWSCGYHVVYEFVVMVCHGCNMVVTSCNPFNPSQSHS